MTTVANGTQYVAYTGIDAAASAFTGCTAPAHAGTAGTGANATGLDRDRYPALTQTPFTMNVSSQVTQGFARAGMLRRRFDMTPRAYQDAQARQQPARAAVVGA